MQHIMPNSGGRPRGRMFGMVDSLCGSDGCMPVSGCRKHMVLASGLDQHVAPGALDVSIKETNDIPAWLWRPEPPEPLPPDAITSMTEAYDAMLEEIKKAAEAEAERERQRALWLSEGGWHLVETGGRVGLTNIRNTCWMNSVVQCLSHIVPFTANFISAHGDSWADAVARCVERSIDEEVQHKESEKKDVGVHYAVGGGLGGGPAPGNSSDSNPFVITLRLRDLLQQLWQETQYKALSPWRFHLALTVNSSWQVRRAFRAPQDAQEFFVFVLNALQAEVESLAKQESEAHEAVSDKSGSSGGGTSSSSSSSAIPSGGVGVGTYVCDTSSCSTGSSTRCPDTGRSAAIGKPAVAVAPTASAATAAAELAGTAVTAEPQQAKQKNYNFIQELFEGEMQSTLECCECSYQSETREPFVQLPVPVTDPGQFKAVELQDLLAAFMAEERLDGDNKWGCDACSKQVRAIRRYGISRFPLVLVLHLKRIQFNHQTGKVKKVSSHVKLPNCSLDSYELNSYALPSAVAAYADSNGSVLYDLASVVNHHGRDAFCGHYTAHARHAIDKEWYSYDDVRVKKLSADQVWLPCESYMICLLKRDWKERWLQTFRCGSSEAT